MNLYEKIYVVFQLLGLLIGLWLMFQALARRQIPAARASAAMLAATSFILATNLIGWISSTDLNVEFLWIRIGYLGMLTLPVAWFCFSLVLGGYERWLKRGIVALLLIIPALVFGAVMTGVMFKEVSYVMLDGAPARVVDFSNWVNLSAGYSYCLFAIGFVLILRSLARATYLRRYQSAALIIATLVPLIFNVIYLAHVFPFPHDLTPLSFAFSGIVFTIGVLRYSVIDLAPVARSAAIDHSRDGILVVDLMGRITDLNPAAQQFLSLGLRAALGRSLADLLPELKGCLSEVSSARCEFTLAVNGQPVNLEATVTLLFVERAYPAGRLIVLHDITALKQIETGLQAALQQEHELGEMKARFYRYFTHQLRTPLSVILSSSELLEHYGHDWSSEKRRKHFQRISQAVHHLTNLSERAAAFEKNERQSQESGVPLCLERFDPREFVVRLTEQAQNADENRHPICLKAHNPVLQVHQDVVLLHDVVENVLSNALKFSPPGSSVQVTLATTPRELSICVQDQGCGIPADELPSVFQPFYRASNAVAVNGSGLGLALANQNIARLGGRLQVESRVNLGTTVWITAPLEFLA